MQPYPNPDPKRDRAKRASAQDSNQDGPLLPPKHSPMLNSPEYAKIYRDRKLQRDRMQSISDKYYNKGQFAKAIKAYEVVLELTPDSKDAHDQLASAIILHDAKNKIKNPKSIMRAVELSTQSEKLSD